MTASPTHKIERTQDGSTTLYNEALDEHYHSCFGARAESLHVFIDNALVRGETSPKSVLEIGFGTGSTPCSHSSIPSDIPTTRSSTRHTNSSLSRTNSQWRLPTPLTKPKGHGSADSMQLLGAKWWRSPQGSDSTRSKPMHARSPLPHLSPLPCIWMHSRPRSVPNFGKSNSSDVSTTVVLRVLTSPPTAPRGQSAEPFSR